MFKVFKIAVSRYKVMDADTGEIVGVYSSVRKATSVADLKNLEVYA